MNRKILLRSTFLVIFLRILAVSTPAGELFSGVYVADGHQFEVEFDYRYPEEWKHGLKLDVPNLELEYARLNEVAMFVPEEPSLFLNENAGFLLSLTQQNFSLKFPHHLEPLEMFPMKGVLESGVMLPSLQAATVPEPGTITLFLLVTLVGGAKAYSKRRR
ncbi:MAG: hypothetical protein ACO1QB_18695 [Verrucomicrobiales bacterium]